MKVLVGLMALFSIFANIYLSLEISVANDRLESLENQIDLVEMRLDYIEQQRRDSPIKSEDPTLIIKPEVY